MYSSEGATYMKAVNAKKNALFLPFMKIPSGHHHVADTLIYELERSKQKWSCDKVDILSYSYGGMEKVVSSTYLLWIKRLPAVYNWLYHHAAYKKASQKKRHYLYEGLFMYFFKRLLNEKRPDILFCTHALPSYMASMLKQKGKLDAAIVNVYTDFFINRVWGIGEVDYHFVPSVLVKNHLLDYGVCEERIFVTGIPVHPAFHKATNQNPRKQDISALVTGGNLGVGAMDKIVSEATGNVHYYVLCGKNEALYQQLMRENKPFITPFPYVTSREEMNTLYEQVDAVITKPGGSTVSECLRKRKPTFVYNPLPGQEKINVDQLQQLGVVMKLDSQMDSVEQQMLHYFSDYERQHNFEGNLEEYHQNLASEPLAVILAELLA